VLDVVDDGGRVALDRGRDAPGISSGEIPVYEKVMPMNRDADVRKDVGRHAARMGVPNMTTAPSRGSSSARTMKV